MTSGSLWNCYRDEMDNVNYNASYGTPFKYKIKITGKTEARSTLMKEMLTDQQDH